MSEVREQFSEARELSYKLWLDKVDLETIVNELNKTMEATFFLTNNKIYMQRNPSYLPALILFDIEKV